MQFQRLLIATVLFLIALGIGTYETTGEKRPLRHEYRLWLGSNTLTGDPHRVTEIQIPAAPNLPAGRMTALDAALILRAVERHGPRALVFLTPVDPASGGQLLESRLQGISFPVVFTSSSGLAELPAIRGIADLPAVKEGLPPAPANAAAGCASAGTPADSALLLARSGDAAVPSNLLQLAISIARVEPAAVTGTAPGSIRAGDLSLPVGRDGAARINPYASSLVDRMSLGELLVDTERSEQGRISAALAARVQNRVVVCDAADAGGAVAVAAVGNGLLERFAPIWVAVLAALIAASLAWWDMPKLDRIVWAGVASGVWFLLAIGIYRQCQILLPISGVALLPIFALFLPGCPRRIK